jgi:hypothetical protein
MMTPSGVEHIGAGVTRERLDEGRIVVFTLSDMSTESVDIWVDACLDAMRDCVEAQRPLLVVQDLSTPGVMQTDYSRSRGNTVTTAYPELEGRIAFVLPEAIVTAYRIGRYVRGQGNQYRRRQLFITREEALAWLRAWPGEPEEAAE